MAYTTAALLESVYLKLQRNPRYTEALRLDGLNKGLIDLTRFISENFKVRNVLNPTDPLDSTRYAVEFPLPTTTLFVESVSFNGRPLRKMTQPEFVATGAEFDVVAESGVPQAPTFPGITPLSYYIRANKFLNLWPRPTTQRTVQIYAILAPPELVNATNEEPELDFAYSTALILYACYWCKLGVPGEETSTADYLKLYERERDRAKFEMSQNSEHKTVRAK